MNSKEAIKWAKENVSKLRWKVLGVSIIAGFLTGLSYSYKTGDSYSTVSLGFLFFFVQVGLCLYLLKTVKGEEAKLEDLFAKRSNFFNLLVIGLIRDIFIALWTLLLIVPGVIKALGYFLVPYLLTDDENQKLGKRELLKKSEEMMNGNKGELFKIGLRYFLIEFGIIMGSIISGAIMIAVLSFVKLVVLGIIVGALIIIAGIAFAVIFFVPEQKLAEAKFAHELLNSK